MAVDLKKYVGNTPTLIKKKDFDTEEDHRLTMEFNKEMSEVRKEFLAKEKRSCISAKKLILTS